MRGLWSSIQTLQASRRKKSRTQKVGKEGKKKPQPKSKLASKGNAGGARRPYTIEGRGGEKEV